MDRLLNIFSGQNIKAAIKENAKNDKYLNKYMINIYNSIIYIVGYDISLISQKTKGIVSYLFLMASPHATKLSLIIRSQRLACWEHWDINTWFLLSFTLKNPISPKNPFYSITLKSSSLISSSLSLSIKTIHKQKALSF